MAGDRAYLISHGTRYQFQVPTGGGRRRNQGRGNQGRHNAGRHRPAARHRLGSRPHQRYCRDLAGVRTRLARATVTRHGRRRGRRIPAAAVLLLVLSSATVVSGWFAATGAVAFAGMMAH